MTKLERWEEELKEIGVTWRWGEARRFHSNAGKVERRNWLIEHIAKERCLLQGHMKPG